MLHLCLERYNLVIEKTSLLRMLSPLITFHRESILSLSTDIKIFCHVLGCLSHWLLTICRILISQDLLVEGLFQPVTAFGHGFCANRNTDIDTTAADFIGNIMDGFEARRAEAVHGGRTGCSGVAGCEGCGAGNVGGFTVGDL